MRGVVMLSKLRKMKAIHNFYDHNYNYIGVL